MTSQTNLIINFKNRRTLVDSLNRDDYKVAVEVGVRTGWFSKYMLDNTKMTVYSIDPWEDNEELKESQKVYAECKSRLEDYQERSVMIKDYSPQAAVNFGDEQVDFVYIDGLHDYQSVKKDIEAWWKKLRIGGILAGHDFNTAKWTGVVRAVSEFCDENNLSCYLTGIVGNSIQSRTGDLDEYDGDEKSWVIFKAHA